MNEKTVILTICLSQKDYDNSEKIREKIDDFTTAVNDKLCDKFKEEIMFDANFLNVNTMVFTIDQSKYILETKKIIEKLLDGKKFNFISNRICATDVCEII